MRLQILASSTPEHDHANQMSRVRQRGPSPLQRTCLVPGGTGLTLQRAPWLAGQWQARVALAHASTHSSSSDPYNIAAHAHGAQWPGRGVLGDFFFQSAATGTVPATFSGFRATSGLIVSPRSFGAPSSPIALLGGKNDDGSAFPYLGIGYTELPGRTGWGFSADFGLMAMNRDAGQFGSA